MKTKFTFATTSPKHTISVIKEVKKVETVADIMILLTPEESVKIIDQAKMLAELKTKGKFYITYLKKIEDIDVE